MNPQSMDTRTQPIHEDIEQIRNSMTDKMSQIENRVRDSVDGTIESVKRSFDLKQHVEERPWTSLGAAVLAGYALGTVNEIHMPDMHMPRPEQNASPSSYAPHSESRLYNEPAQPRIPPVVANVVSGIANQFGDEIEMVKGAAISAAVAFLRDTLKQNMPELSREYERLRQEREQAGEPAGLTTTHDTPAAQSAKASNYTNASDYSRTPAENRSPSVAVS